MFERASISVIIPALNEEASIAQVLASLPPWVDEVIVVDNGSTDRTRAIAAQHGAQVIEEARRGYGAACLAGLAALNSPDIIVFLDADFSDHPEQMDRLVAPIVAGEADLVLGSRMLGNRGPGSLTILQQFGNALTCRLVAHLWGHHFTDLGPFRAIRADLLPALEMDDRTFGWTVQMQIRALRAGFRVQEVAVDYRPRLGRSKISGTVAGVIRAGAKILNTVYSEWRCFKPVRPIAPRKEHMIVFGRFPQPGCAKTRLIPALGAEAAATLHRDMAHHTLAVVDRFAARRPVSVEVRYAGAGRTEFAAMFGGERTYLRQDHGDLGERMHNAFCDAFSRGAQAAVVIGTDCPALDPAMLNDAFDALGSHELVVGPARDGGYYLLGVKQPCAALFQDIPWGSGKVMERTLDRASQLSMPFFLLPELDDVDRPEDLPAWQAVRERPPAVGDEINLSVIIPTLNEEEWIGQAVESAKNATNVEVIVVDGGSRDRTMDVARAKGARIVRSSPGRGKQMNAGAAVADGKILLFLHADTVLSAGYAKSVAEALARPDTSLTAFRLTIDSPRRALAWIARAANWRARWLGMPYGDQAFAVRASQFHELGGFRELPIMEDYELVRACRRIGRIKLLSTQVRTSSRRWMNEGPFATTLRNQLCIMGHMVGVNPDRLARWRQTPSTTAGSADSRQSTGPPLAIAFRASRTQDTIGD